MITLKEITINSILEKERAKYLIKRAHINRKNDVIIKEMMRLANMGYTDLMIIEGLKTSIGSAYNKSSLNLVEI